MSHRNHPDQKAARRSERAARKGKSTVPHQGVVVTKQMVLGQRYNASRGLPFSMAVAAVAIIASVKPEPLMPLMGARRKARF